MTINNLPQPDLILHNGNIITLEDGQPQAEAIAVQNDRIIAVGNNQDILALDRLRCSKRIDLQGHTALPGLIDGHAHLDREGLRTVYPSLGPVNSIKEIQQKLAALVAQAEPGEWIVLMPLELPPEYTPIDQLLQDHRYPNRHDLDEVAPNNPVYIRPIWGFWRHSLPLVSVANSAALKQAGIDENTEPVSKSIVIEKDNSGTLTGLFLEQSFMPMVELNYFKEATRFSLRARTQSLPHAINAYLRYGTTSIFEGHGVTAEVFRSYQQLHRQNQLDIRASLVLSPNWKSANFDELEQFIEAWCSWLGNGGLGDQNLRMAGMFIELGPGADNQIRARAYPSTGWAGFNYDAGLSREQAIKLLKTCAHHQIQVVAIVPDFIDIFHEVHQSVPINGLRWVIGHISVIRPQQIPQLKEMGVIVTTHTNRYIYKEGPQLQKQLGPVQENQLVPLRALLDEGVPVVLATDNSPVSLFHPIWHASERPGRRHQEPVVPSQAISRYEALKCASLNGALLTHEEQQKGSLKQGKLADIAVITANPLSCAAEQLPHIEALLTIKGGQIVFQNPDICSTSLLK